MGEIYIPFIYTNGLKMIGFKIKLQIGSLKEQHEFDRKLQSENVRNFRSENVRNFRLENIPKSAKSKNFPYKN